MNTKEKMTVYVVSQAVQLTGDYAGNDLDGLSTYAKVYRTRTEAEEGLTALMRDEI